MIRYCAFCGKPLENYRRLVYCDWNCRTQHSRQRRRESARNKKIIADCEKGIYTLQELGFKYGLSRERIRQIYFEITGEKYDTYQKRNRRIKTKREEINEQKIKFICSQCKKKVTWKEGKGKRKYCIECSGRMHVGSHRDFRITLYCQQCHTPFHPYDTSIKKGISRALFCTRPHFYDYIKEKRLKKLASLLDGVEL